MSALAGTGLLFAATGLGQSEPAEASWTRSAHNNATLSSGQLNPVTSLTCDAGSGLSTAPINLTWTQPVTTGNGLTPSSYTMSWSGSAGSGSTTVPGLTAAVATGGLAAGDLTVSVRASISSWQSVVSSQTRTVQIVAVMGVVVSWTCV